jgi:Na+-translocating ferredoxin:NAD+ oxidoreductase RnfD subunit
LSDNFTSLAVALTAVAAAALTEFFINLGRRSRNSIDGSAVASALVLTIILPNTINPIFAAAGAVFAIAVVKQSFGGLGANWLNPALGGWLFIRLSWPTAFDAATQNAEALSSGFMGLFSASATHFLNNNIFRVFNIEIPVDYFNLLFYSAAGIIADRGVFAFLIGSILLSAFRSGRFWASALFLLFYLVLLHICGSNLFTCLFSGGTLVAAFLLITDPSSGVKSLGGAIITAVLTAGVAALLRVAGNELYGAIYAVVLINSVTPLIRGIEDRYLYRRELC